MVRVMYTWPLWQWNWSQSPEWNSPLQSCMCVQIEFCQRSCKYHWKNQYFGQTAPQSLRYIKIESRRFQTFVANRVYIIREASDVSQWRHVGTKLNSDDYASRGLQANAFLKCKDWISGPDFLKESAEQWPNSPSDLILSADDPEVKHGHIFVNATVKGDHNPTSTLLHHFSSWSKLKKAVAWYLKVRNVLLQLSRKWKEILTSVSVNKSHQDKQKHLVAA